MRFSQLAVAAGIASTSAFLIPTEISSSEVDIIKSLPFADAISADNRLVEIACPGCPTASTEGEMGITQVKESTLQLNFSLKHDDDGDKLMLNEMQIYPLDLAQSSRMEPLKAEQFVKNNDNTWTSAGSPTLGYSMSTRHPMDTADSESKLNMVSIHIEIIEVADKFLNGLPTIDLKVLETPSHKLMIGDATIAAPVQSISPPQGECTTLACRWRAIIADRLAQLQALKAQALKKAGCGKGKGQNRPAIVTLTPGFKHHGGHHGEHSHSQGPDGAHRSFRHHHRHGRVARFIRGIVMHVLLPALMGVMVGITASLIGMVVGHIAIFLWRITFRRGQRAEYSGVAQADAETTDDEEKSFLEHQEAPPQYEIVVVDEKNEVV